MYIYNTDVNFNTSAAKLSNLLNVTLTLNSMRIHTSSLQQFCVLGCVFSRIHIILLNIVISPIKSMQEHYLIIYMFAKMYKLVSLKDMTFLLTAFNTVFLAYIILVILLNFLQII